VRSLPRIVSKIPNDLRNFLDRVREYMSEGGEERFVTLRELKAGGIVSTTPAGTIDKPAVYGIEKSKAPTGLTTTGALASVIIEWGEPNYLGHSHAEIWAATTNDFTLKELVGTAEGIVFSHNIGSGATRYYWVRFVNTEQVAGPFNDTVGTVGVTGQNPDYLIEVLSDAYGVAGPAPFFQLDNPTVINGVTIPAGTYIKQAWIADATISRAKIQDLAVDSAKISDLTASKITAGNIQTGYIRSTSYTAGASGWSINADGSANFYGNLLAGSATAYVTGIGLFSGFVSGTYKWRVGNPSGARIEWDGSAVYVYASDNTVTLASGGIDYSKITGTKPPADADKTSLNTAAAIANQGIFATAGQLSAAGTYPASTYIAGLALNTPLLADNSVSKIDTVNITTTTLTNPPASAYSSTTNTILASIPITGFSEAVERIVMINLRFTHYDSTPGYFTVRTSGGPINNLNFLQDPPPRLIDGQNDNNYTFIGIMNTNSISQTSLGSLQILIQNGSTSAAWWGGTAPDVLSGKVVIFARKK
jgi:hypothetical protein